jgi:hypothetical protein
MTSATRYPRTGLKGKCVAVSRAMIFIALGIRIKRSGSSIKWFQVIGSCGPRSWPACLALGGAAGRTRRCLGVLSAASFGSNGSLLPRSSVASPNRSWHLEAVFRSPGTTVRHRAAVARSLFPTCLFNTLPNAPRARSADNSTADVGLPRCRRSQHCQPVSRFLFVNPGLASVFLPFGRCIPSGSPAKPIGYRKARLTETVQFLGAPRFRLYC